MFKSGKPLKKKLGPCDSWSLFNAPPGGSSLKQMAWPPLACIKQRRARHWVVLLLMGGVWGSGRRPPQTEALVGTRAASLGLDFLPQIKKGLRA